MFFPGRILFQPGHPYTYTSRKTENAFWKQATGEYCIGAPTGENKPNSRAWKWALRRRVVVVVPTGGQQRLLPGLPPLWVSAWECAGPGGSALPSTIATFLYSSRSFCIYMVILPVYFNTTDFSISLSSKWTKKSPINLEENVCLTVVLDVWKPFARVDKKDAPSDIRSQMVKEKRERWNSRYGAIPAIWQLRSQTQDKPSVFVWTVQCSGNIGMTKSEI